MASLSILVSILISCGTVPLSGRKQLNMIPNSEMLAMSFQQYDQFLQENNTSQDNSNAQMVKRVGQKIQVDEEQYGLLVEGDKGKLSIQGKRFLSYLRAI